MTGWRVGMAVGNADLISSLAKVKANIDSGIFTPVQMAAVEALRNSEKVKEEMNAVYAARRDRLVNGLRALGWEAPDVKATFYVWLPVIKGYTSTSLAKMMLEKADLIVTPGNGFGPSGEGYIRMALTVGEEKLEEAVCRIKKAFFS
jgi:LL-diaminopimelate aminotransferase